jgi:hypothetical protein
MPIDWKNVQKWLGDTTDVAVRESKELVRKGKIQYNILGLKHSITKSLTELGGAAYQMIQKKKAETIAADEKVQELVRNIRALELELKRKEKEKATRKY